MAILAEQALKLDVNQTVVVGLVERMDQLETSAKALIGTSRDSRARSALMWLEAAKRVVGKVLPASARALDKVNERIEELGML